jgi:hypothetical protein
MQYNLTTTGKNKARKQSKQGTQFALVAATCSLSSTPDRHTAQARAADRAAATSLVGAWTVQMRLVDLTAEPRRTIADKIDAKEAAKREKQQEKDSATTQTQKAKDKKRKAKEVPPRSLGSAGGIH